MNRLTRIACTVAFAAALAACNRTAPAPASTDGGTPATTAAAPTASATPETPLDPQIVAAAQAAAESVYEHAKTTKPVAGKDYVVIDNGSPLLPLDGKVEITEVFAYWCPHCNEFQPLVDAWKAKLPDYVRFTPVPMAGGQNDTLAKVFYAAEMTNQLDKVHDRMFGAIHRDRVLKPNATQEEVLAFLGSHGLDAKAFGSTMDSFAMTGKLNQAKQFEIRSGIEGTPTLVVNGKYRVQGDTQEDMLRIATALAAQEHAAGTGK